MAKKVFIIGLDSAPPEILFDRADELPNFNYLKNHGIYGPLRSCHPPITIPAWMVMSTSKNPGKLGIYGFRHRRGYSYTDFWISSSYSIKEPTIWDILSKYGKRSTLVGVPPTYPPKPINGNLISCFITPDTDKEYTYPPQLKDLIKELVGEYKVDVEFRTDNKDKLLADIYAMTEKRFKVIKHLIGMNDWTFFMWVEIGIDRMQHAFWKFFDSTHHLYQPQSKYSNAIMGYYKYMDHLVGELLSLLDKDTTILVVSDHGAKGMKGAFCINEWLLKRGYLAFKEEPETGVDITKASVDWSRTKAWGWGGYYSRVFLNVRGRESIGIIPPEEYESFREELITAFKEIRGPNGEKWETLVFKPENFYLNPIGDYSDLMVYFDDLAWRAAGTLGHPNMYLPENDTGPDDAVHSQDGIFILYDPDKEAANKKMFPSHILNIAPTVLHQLDIPIPHDMEGKVIKS